MFYLCNLSDEMFVDRVTVLIKAGDGGNGIVSFRREKFIDRGGPDGGNGGMGGDIVAIASDNQDTLASYRYKKTLRAADGQPGGKRKRQGKHGTNLELLVPVGTVITRTDGTLVADMIKSGQQVVVAHGGQGGYGNAHFISSVRQAPRVAEKGDKGDEFEAVLELKMIADVGLVGLPNAGKSTLLASSSNARPQIADYPFTTLVPNLGIVHVGDSALLCADIPGLIEGAASGKGLGDEFLRHVERTSCLIHVIDAYNTEITTAYKIIQGELVDYSPSVAAKPQVVALNKTEGLDLQQIKAVEDELRQVVPRSTQVFAISAKSGQGVKELFAAAKTLVDKQKAKQTKKSTAKTPVIRYQTKDEDWTTELQKDSFVVRGAKIERFAARTDFANPHGVHRLRDIMRKMGIMANLEKQGIEPGQKIFIGTDYTIEY